MVVYEMARFPFLTVSIITFFLMMGGLAVTYNYAEKYYTTKKWKYLFVSMSVSVISLVLIWVFIIAVMGGGSDDYRYARKYYNGNYHAVKGEIRDFQSENVNGNIRKSFYVGDIYFQQERMAIN